MSRCPYTPRAYQELATSHLLDTLRSALWASMGLGKTVSTLTALDRLFMCEVSQPALVLAPLRVARNVWPREAEKWGHLRNISVMPIIGSEHERRRAMRHDASVYTCNYENLEWLVDYWGERWPYSTVVSDESTRLKSYRGSVQVSKTGKEFIRAGGGKRARALGKVAHTRVKRFYELTGTPSPNGLADLWGQMWFLDAGQRLGRTFSGYVDRFFKTSYDGYGVAPLPFAQKQIYDKLRDLCLTLDAKEYFDLDEPIVNNIYVDLPPKARRHYEDMEKRMFSEIEEHEIEAFGAAARTQKCLQLANGAAYVGCADDPGGRKWVEVHNAKLDALESCVEEAGGMPMLVAYEFKSDLKRILKAFPKARLLDQNPGTEDDWNAGKIPLLLAHPASAGHGLNLQEGGNIITFFGHNWNLELRLQIIERIGPTRQKQSGYDRPVFINHIIARDTVDELVMTRIETKREVQDILLEAMKRRQK